MKTLLTQVTIVSESLIKDELLSVVRRHGASGYTLSRVEGEGSRSTRAHEIERHNVRIETIVSPQTADAILGELAERYFEDFAVIAWLTEVNVLRGEKFVSEE